MNAPRVTYPGRKALLHVQRYEERDYGVLIKENVAEKLFAQGLITSANRRPYARESDVCVRLTEAGRAYLESLNHA